MHWSLASFIRRLKTPRRQPITRARLGLEYLEDRLAPSVSVVSHLNNNVTSGQNLNETQLTPANVQVGSFGKLFSVTLDGQVYAEPLVLTNVTTTDGPNTPSGTSTAGNYSSVVFVATENDSLYAIDGSVSGGKIIWQRSFASASNPTGDINNTLNATSITAVNSGLVGSDISPVYGITGTPVIDPNTGIVYVVAFTEETINGITNFVQRLHAISVANGEDVTTPYLIGDTSGTNTNTTQIYTYGTGDGSVTDPYNGTGNSVVQFNALRENQRAALSIVNNTVYVQWSSHNDNTPWHGWVVSWNVSNIGMQGFVLNGVLDTSPNGGGAGIWGGGGALSFDPDESGVFYFETGNGLTGAGNPTLNANGFPVTGDYYEAVVKAEIDPTTSPTNQHINGWGFKVVDYFIPYNAVALDDADEDLGSGSPLILPDSAGIPGHPHLLVASGKEGKIYVIDRDNMGKFNPNGDNVVNSVPNGDGTGVSTPTVQIGGSLSTPTYYNGTLYWVSGYNASAYAFQLTSTGTLTQTSQTTATFGYIPGSVFISARQQ